MVANKKASHDERLAKGLSTLIFQGDSHKPRSAGFGTFLMISRLPRSHRAGPSTSLDEYTVVI